MILAIMGSGNFVCSIGYDCISIKIWMGRILEIDYFGSRKNCDSEAFLEIGLERMKWVQFHILSILTCLKAFLKEIFHL
jgi:hypothetical protein